LLGFSLLFLERAGASFAQGFLVLLIKQKYKKKNNIFTPRLTRPAIRDAIRAYKKTTKIPTFMP
jgi:hypothetical protein